MIDLSIVIGTRNRLPILTRAIRSVQQQTARSHDVVVVDAGSTDGTQDHVAQMTGVRLVCDGACLGQARSLNRVFRNLHSRYVCWLSDDNVVQSRQLDEAVSILECQPAVGMVALKVRDVCGGREFKPYIAGIRSSGILTCNQGLLSLDFFRGLGFFDEEFVDYGIDTDLTARVLLTGRQVVMTKTVALWHYRDHDHMPGAIANEDRRHRIARSYELFSLKHPHLEHPSAGSCRRLAVRRLIWRGMAGMLGYSERGGGLRMPSWLWDWRNVLCARYVRVDDAWRCRSRSFHLVQQVGARRIERTSP